MSQTTRHHWENWRETCALALSEGETQEHLTRFLAIRFHAYAARYAHRCEHPQAERQVPGDADCAHLFETWCALHQRRDGKAYKHWLLARGDVSALESGASLLLRDVVREWLRREFSPRGTQSLQTNLGTEGSPLSLEDLLPARDPQGIARGEWEAWLGQQLPRWLHALDRAESACLAARARNLPFTHPSVVAAAGMGKSTLHSRYRQRVLAIGENIRDAFPSLDAESGVACCLEALDQLAEQLSRTFSLEKPTPPAFGKQETSHEP